MGLIPFRFPWRWGSAPVPKSAAELAQEVAARLLADRLDAITRAWQKVT